MITKRQDEDSRLAQIASDAYQLLASLLSGKPTRREMMVWLDEIYVLVDCMVLGTSEYGLAKLRIDNARRFVGADEIGAAKFEIRHLKSRLKEQLRFRDVGRQSILRETRRHAIVPIPAYVGFPTK